MKENTILYAITAGSYSDYHICAIASSKERAEQLLKYYADHDDTSIEEYIDGEPDLGNLNNLEPVYWVHIRSNGECYGDILKYDVKPYKNEYELVEDSSSFLAWTSIESSPTVFRAKIMAMDLNHAIKIAQDQYAKMRAEKEGL